MKTFLYGLLSSIFVFLTPVLPLIILVGFFISADTLLGVYTAKKLKNKVTSRKLSRIIGKLIIYTGTILLVFGLDTQIFGMFIETDLLITKLGAGVLCFIEGFSIDENIRKINKDRGTVYYVQKMFDLIKTTKKKYNDTFTKDN